MAANGEGAGKGAKTRPGDEERKVEKTIVVPVQAADPALGAPEAAGEDLARLPLPQGWEISLDVLAGRDEGASFNVTRSRVLLGRGSVDVRLDDSHVSREHASLEVYGANCVLLKDLGSTNGTLVNGKRIKVAELEDGDTIELGATRLAITIGIPPSSG